MNISKLFRDHAMLIQTFNEYFYKNSKAVNNLDKISDVASKFSLNSKKIGMFLAEESIPEKFKSTPDGKMVMKNVEEEWQSIFYGTSGSPGHIRLIGSYIESVHKERNKKKTDTIFKELTQKNFTQIINFWHKIDKMIYKSPNKHVLDTLKNVFLKFLVSIIACVNTLNRIGFGNEYTKITTRYHNHSMHFSDFFDDYFDGIILKSNTVDVKNI